MRTRLGYVPILLALAAIVISFLLFSGFRQAQLSRGVPLPVQVMPSYRSAPLTAKSPIDAVATVSGNSGSVLGRVIASGPALAQLPRPPRGARGPSQLIRTATISLEVTDVTRALRAATALADAELGDVIALDNRSPASPDAIHTATMQIRVPQYRFERTLDAFAQLGKIKASSVNASDISDQIVDSQARLRNLRRTEADILKIMDRSGNIEQVLSVTQQLGEVRDQIERLDAQIKGMQYQVDYSTISIDFSSPVIVSAPTGFGLLGDVWKAALASLEGITVGLLGGGLWLIAFSPYILLAVLLGVLALRLLLRHRAVTDL